MLFNLSCQRHFPNKRYGQGICCSTSEGPSYGWNELSAFYEPFNGYNKCYSYAGKANYGIPEEGGKNTLTNLKGNNFTITELEVWSIKEICKKFYHII